jgi:hypothetical protein
MPRPPQRQLRYPTQLANPRRFDTPPDRSLQRRPASG